MKVIQWYVSDIPNPHINRHLSNYFPWHSLKQKSVLQTIKDMDENKGVKDIGRYSFRSDPVWHSWEEYNTQTEIRFINKDSYSYSSSDINIFPIRFVANDDQIFTHKDLCPFGNLPENVIKWLKAHTDCGIVFHDVHEAKAVSSKDFVTIPALIVKRKEYDLENKFVFIDSHANTDSIYKNRYYDIPWWLTFLSCSHWMQFVAHTKDKNHMHEIERLSARKPLFTKGRFICYSGRFRPARYTYLHKLISQVNPDNLWLKVSKPIDIENPDKEIKEIVRYQKHIQDMHMRKSYYNISDTIAMTDLYNKLPIDTFPDGIKEENINYHHLKWFWLPNPMHYSRSFIDISPETYNEREGPYYDDLFITEKICKPLFARRPFMTSANPGLYYELKKLGFRTFDRWWDESFAEEGDIKKHIDKLVKEIKRIDNMSVEECKKMWEEMQDTLLHNQRLILYYTYEAPRFWITELKKARAKKLI